MKRLAMITTALVAASAALTTPAAAATAISLQPSLISDVAIRAADSPLVRAAKNSVAARMREASRSTGVLINDEYIRTHSGGRITTSSGAAELPAVPSRSSQDAGVLVPSAASNVDRAALEREQTKLRQEQARAASEMDEPYGGNNMEEDHAAQRLNETTKQIDQNQQQLHPPQE